MSEIEDGLRNLTVQGWRLELEWDGEDTESPSSIPMLRGAWGAALHDVSLDWYRRFFGAEPAGGSDPPPGASPRYVLRQAQPRAGVERGESAIEFLAFGELEGEGRRALRDSWRLAGERGLGARRTAFRLGRIIPLARDGEPEACGDQDQDRDWSARGFALSPLPWPVAGGDVAAGCRIEFPVPVRMLERGLLIDAPGLPDLTIAMIRRARTLNDGDEATEALWRNRHEWLRRAREIRAGWRAGSRLDLLRYSGSQRREIRMPGARGGLDLPDGPGALAPLLAAAQWTHLGKGTVMGLGRPWLRALTQEGESGPDRDFNPEAGEAAAAPAVHRRGE